MRARRTFTLVVAILLIVVVGCASTNLAPIGSAGRFTQENDEQQIWSAAREAENRIVPPKNTFEDSDLERYLSGLAGRVVPASYVSAGGEGLRVKVRKDPRLNAMAMPHGLIVVHTGTLARVENESQLAGVLAHEITHVTHRHQVREARAIRNRQTAAAVVGFIGLLALTAAAVDQSNRGNPEAAEAIVRGGGTLLQLGLQLSYTAMVTGYSRDLEREADEEGMRLMAAAGHSLTEMAGFFRLVLQDAPDRGRIETFFYGSHPRTSERIQTVDQLASTISVASVTTTSNSEFNRRMGRVRVANAQYDAYLGRVRLARQQIDRTLPTIDLGARPIASRMYYGHMYTAASVGAGSRNDDANARQFFDAAESAYKNVINELSGKPWATSTLSAAYNSLGRLYENALGGSPCNAKRAYEKSLEANPTGRDAESIRSKAAQLTC